MEKPMVAPLKPFLKPENKTKLQGVLTYYVLVGKYSAKDVMKGTKSPAPTMPPF